MSNLRAMRIAKQKAAAGIHYEDHTQFTNEDRIRQFRIESSVAVTRRAIVEAELKTGIRLGDKGSEATLEVLNGFLSEKNKEIHKSTAMIANPYIDESKIPVEPYEKYNWDTGQTEIITPKLNGLDMPTVNQTIREMRLRKV